MDEQQAVSQPMAIRALAQAPFIAPTPGRIVWYRANEYVHADLPLIVGRTHDGPLAAIITGTYADGTVNLAVFGFDGSGPHKREGVVLSQEAGNAERGQCTWMPYQKGQAAKAEQLENKLGLQSGVGVGTQQGPESQS